MPEFNGIWAGSDESGKGDFFGPLVVAAVACDEKSASRLFSLGVKDCKIVSDKDVLKMKDEICSAALAVSVLALTPKMYNYRYNQLKAAGQNLNHLLSSGHAAALSGVIGKCPGCGYALVDRFTVHNDITQRIHEKYPAVKVVQMPKAEADIAVAAASVLARAEFLRIMAELEAQAGMLLPKGGSDAATSCARMIAKNLAEKALQILLNCILPIINVYNRRIYEKLIINADDFGLHPLINKGIIEGHQKGMITSTSIMPGAPYLRKRHILLPKILSWESEFI